jgi:hypothetical protein
MKPSRIPSRPPLTLMLVTLVCALAVLGPGSYWLNNYQHLPARADTDLMARWFAALAPVNSGYYDAVGEQQIGLVGTTLVVGTVLYASLFLAWLRRSAAAVPLALAAGSIGCYAIVISGWIGMLDGFANTARTTTAAMSLFGLSAAWFGIHLALIVDAVRRVAQAIQTIGAEQGQSRGRR